MADKEKEKKEKAGTDNNVFAVEKLIRTKLERGKTFYLVKWKGWSARHNTWEPEENILDLALLQDYREREEKKTQKKAEKAEKASAKRASSGSSKKATPEQPPSKKKRRLAGGDIREESSESSEHDEAEAPSTSGTPAAAAPSQEEEEPPSEPIDVEEQLEEPPAEPTPSEGTEGDRILEDVRGIQHSPVVEDPDFARNGEEILMDEEEEEAGDLYESGMIDFDGNDEEDHTMEETVTMPEDGYIVGHLIPTELEAPEAAFIMGLTETETNQTNQHHLQLLRRFGPTEREMEDELRRSEEIKHELRSENCPMMPTHPDGESSSGSEGSGPDKIGFLEVDFADETVQIAEF